MMESGNIASISEVLAISVPPPPHGTPGRRRINLGIFGNQTFIGVITFVALLATVSGALIAYFDWQINKAASVSASPSPTVPPSPMSSEPATASPSAAVPRSSSPVTPTSPPKDLPTTETSPLSYRLSATAVSPDTVKVTADASGQPQPGLTYWFIVETNWGNGNIDYFPRRKLTGATQDFEVTLPPDADPKFVRHGRIYGLTSTQSADAEGKMERQSTTRVDDYFDRGTGQISSNAARLPFT